MAIVACDEASHLGPEKLDLTLLLTVHQTRTLQILQTHPTHSMYMTEKIFEDNDGNNHSNVS